jgi:uncharacterized protein (TIGR03118 family)
MDRHRVWCRSAAIRLPRALVLLVIVTAVSGCGNDDINGPGFEQSNLVANTAGTGTGPGPIVDPNLLNPWGIAHSPTGPWWVSDNHAGVSTLYDGMGHPLPTTKPLVVTIPPPQGSPPDTTASPTGIVFNPTADFAVGSGGLAGPALFIFSTEDGTISGWNENANPTAAILTVDNSSTGAIYKGLAIGSNGTANFLYATNFHAGTVDVFDRTFAPVSMSGAFTDSTIPSGFAPFGIQNIDGDIFVTYAKQDGAKEDDVPGLGNGYVDVFDADGNLVRHFVSQGQLNSPWGIAQAPASFGRFGGAIIIGNFGDGHLNAFDPISGTFLGQLNLPSGPSVTIPGLWGLGFGNGAMAGSVDTLYFSAGPNGEKDGLFGTLQPVDT